jgi:phage gp37-like protein
VYKLIADGHPKDGFDPTGATRLQRVYHLHNCDERYADMAHSLIEGLSAHSAWSSVKYIDIVVEKLQEERNNLINDYKLEPKPLAHIADSHTYHTEPDAVPEQTPADEGQTGS